MDNTQEIALQRINDSDYIKYEGTKEEIELLHSLMERVAKSDYGAKIITGLKKTEELLDNHQIVLKIQDVSEVGLPSAAGGVHKGNGEIVLFKHGRDQNDPSVSLAWAQTLAHELCHEEQYQQGLVPNSHFTPEQNFIINRLQELDAGCLRREDDLIKGGFEGVGIAGNVASAFTYNEQALLHAFDHLTQTDPKPDKTFEEIRAIYVKRLGVNIEPEYFSAQTLANSASGKKFFNNNKLSIQHETINMSDGKLSVFKHPVFDFKTYKPENGKIGVEEQITHNQFNEQGRISIRFFDQQTDKIILGVSQEWNGYRIQTKQNPDKCADIKEFEETFAQLNLPKDVLEALSFDAEVIKNKYNEKQGEISPNKPWEKPTYDWATKHQDKNAPENVAGKLQNLRGISSTGSPAPQQQHLNSIPSKQSSFSFPLSKGNFWE